MKIWLDDCRDPKDYGCSEAIWVRTGEEAIRYIRTGKVDFISFDHDLGEGVSGSAVAYVIERLCYEGQIKCPLWETHSQNPVGCESIEASMRSAMKFSPNSFAELACK